MGNVEEKDGLKPGKPRGTTLGNTVTCGFRRNMCRSGLIQQSVPEQSLPKDPK